MHICGFFKKTYLFSNTELTFFHENNHLEQKNCHPIKVALFPPLNSAHFTHLSCILGDLSYLPVLSHGILPKFLSNSKTVS